MAENSPIPLDARLFSGSDKDLNFVVPQAAGLANGWHLSWTAWDDEAKGMSLLVKSSPGGIAVQDNATGTFKVMLDADTDWDFLPPGSYYYELWREDSGARDVLAYGALMVR